MPASPDESLRKRILQKVDALPGSSLPVLDAYLDLLGASQSAPAPLNTTTATVPLTSPAQSTMPWPRAPLHRLSEKGTYFVTGATLHREHFFRSKRRLAELESRLLSFAADHGWHLEASAVFSNHYHFVGSNETDAAGLKKFLQSLHADTARWLNHLDGETGRTIWFNYRETQLTFEKSYLARLNYVHQNPVRHGLVRVANHYPWCSAAWFERTASPAQVKTIYGFKIDRVQVPDDFEPVFVDDES